jgi:hypothetical protein
MGVSGRDMGTNMSKKFPGTRLHLRKETYDQLMHLTDPMHEKLFQRETQTDPSVPWPLCIRS